VLTGDVGVAAGAAGGGAARRASWPADGRASSLGASRGAADCSATTVGATCSGGVIWTMLTASTATVAAVASGYHQRLLRLRTGAAPTARRASARIAASSAGGGSSWLAARHAVSTSRLRSISFIPTLRAIRRPY